LFDHLPIRNRPIRAVRRCRSKQPAINLLLAQPLHHPPSSVLPARHGRDNPLLSTARSHKIMAKLGYGPDKHLLLKVATRNFPGWRGPAVIMISHFKEIYVESGVDDPDRMYYENYV
jgi:hypothetical protein